MVSSLVCFEDWDHSSSTNVKTIYDDGYFFWDTESWDACFSMCSCLSLMYLEVGNTRNFKKASLKEFLVIFTTSFLWHESEDKQKKACFQNFIWFHIWFYVFKLCMIYVCFIAPIDHCVEWSLMYETFCENCSHFILKWFQPNFLGKCAS